MFKAVYMNLSSDEKFDSVFRSYVKFKNIEFQKLDRDVRAPLVFQAFWRDYFLIPAKSKIILITGSKGKGTSARWLAWNLQAIQCKVGLVVSPEEVHHLDRIRLNNTPISSEDFERILQKILPILEIYLLLYAPDRYLSPTGIFLTIALVWFKEMGVDYYVIEGGRGVLYDEIGQLNASLGIVTNIFSEHLIQLGGKLEDVVRDKLSLGLKCDTLLISEQANKAIEILKLQKNKLPNNIVIAQPFNTAKQIINDTQPNIRFPAWLCEAAGLVSEALNSICVKQQTFQWFNTPSFFQIHVLGATLICEPIVHALSLELEFLERLRRKNVELIVGLSDDKDVNNILNTFAKFGLNSLAAFELASPVRHITSEWIKNTSVSVIKLGYLDCVHPDLNEFRDAMRKFIKKDTVYYVIGIQIFIRTVRLAYSVEMIGNKNGN